MSTRHFMKIKLNYKKIISVAACFALAGLSSYSGMKLLKNREENLNKNTITNKQIEFILDSNATTGYKWHYLVNDESILNIESYYVSDRNYDDKGFPLCGVGGVEYFHFNSIKSGSCKVSMWYSRSDDINDADNIDEYLFTVDENLNISYEKLNKVK